MVAPDMRSSLGYYKEEEAFWQKRQVKLRQMSGLKFSDENCHEPEQENYCALPLSPPLQLNCQGRDESWAQRLPLVSLPNARGSGNRAALELHKQVLAVAEIREDLEQQLQRIEAHRQALTERKVAEQRRLIRLLDAQLAEACGSCAAHEKGLRELLGDAAGQLQACTAMLDGKASMPNKAALTDMLAQVDFLQRKRAMLQCTLPAAPSLQAASVASPLGLPTQGSAGLLSVVKKPAEALSALRQAVGLPTDEERLRAAESLLTQSPNAKSGNPTRQLKRAYAAMLTAVKEHHLAEKEHLIQACQKELSAQKAAYERAMAELLSRQQAQAAQQPEAAAAALRSHPLAETPPREPPAKQSAGPPLNGQAPKMPVLRRSPLCERQRPGSASLQRLSAARRKPAALSPGVHAAQVHSSCRQLDLSESAPAHASLVQGMEPHAASSSLRQRPNKAGQADAVALRQTHTAAAVLETKLAASTFGAPAAVLRSPFQAAQQADADSSKDQSAASAAQALSAGGTKGGRTSLDGTATALPLHPSSNAHPDVADAGMLRIGLRSPDSASGSLGMAAPKDPGSPFESGSPTFRALAQHAASIESFLAGGDASVSAREESTALAQLMQVLNGAAPEDVQQ